MTLIEIKAAIADGKKVYWANKGYEVIYDQTRGCDQYLIKCTWNQHCIGLTHADGVTMNGQPEQFFT